MTLKSQRQIYKKEKLILIGVEQFGTNKYVSEMLRYSKMYESVKKFAEYSEQTIQDTDIWKKKYIKTRKDNYYEFFYSRFALRGR